MEEYILKVENLNKYFGQNQVLHQVHLSVKPGEICGLIGANGSGKSTLMNILFGSRVIEKTGGYEGEVWYDGEKVQIRSAKDAIARGIGMIHQEFILIPEMTVAENIKLTRENTKKKFNRILKPEISYLDKKKDQEDAGKILEELGFQIDSSYLIKNISVNAKQFVEIAREVDKQDLKLLLLDEPAAGMNPNETIELMDTIRFVRDNFDMTVLLIEHDMKLVSGICEELTVLNFGQVLAQGKTKDVLNDPEVIKAYLGE